MPLTGVVNLTVSLYSVDDCADENASALWSEIHEDVELNNGVFNIKLGGGKNLPTNTKFYRDIKFNEEYCLGILG